jgi:diguanylate cyclase (GGDEF)-like protein/PAS domain S-box-containing protein
MSDRYEYIVNLSHDFITLINRNYEYEIVNDAYCQTMELPREQILYRPVSEVWGREKFENTIKEKLDRCLAGEEIHYIDRFPFGSNEKAMHLSFYPYREDDEGDISHVLVFSHDISRLSEAESQLQEYEYRDRLTGLFNRKSLDVMLSKEIERAKRARSEEHMALLFCALKNFKRINQLHGHHIGDLLLENTALRINECVRESDMVFRFEGSNLAVLLTSVSRSTDAAVVAQKVIDAVAVPYRYRNTDIAVSCYVGISVYPEDGDDPQELVQRANSASVEAEDHEDGFLLFDSTLHERAVQRLTMQTELQRAFEHEQFELYFQPLYRVDREAATLIGAEALIRWHHPSRGFLEPAEFIELAEDTRVVAAIDKWAVYQVAERLSQWAAARDLFLTVNLSASELSDQYLLDVVAGAFRNVSWDQPHKLKLELTERSCMQDPEASIERIQRLRDHDVEVWIDDFGTGQSSLSYLKRLPSDTLKIDRYFIEELELSDEDRFYLGSIISSIRARGKEVVVEGVRNEKQRQILVELGCTLMQGFLFSEPLPAAQFEALLQSSDS